MNQKRLARQQERSKQTTQPAKGSEHVERRLVPKRGSRRSLPNMVRHNNKWRVQKAVPAMLQPIFGPYFRTTMPQREEVEAYIASRPIVAQWEAMLDEAKQNLLTQRSVKQADHRTKAARTVDPRLGDFFRALREALDLAEQMVLKPYSPPEPEPPPSPRVEQTVKSYTPPQSIVKYVPMDAEYMSVRAICERYGWSKATIHRFLNAEKITAKKMGRKTMISVASVEAYVNDLPNR